jgi:hypothetical protein
VGWGGNYQDISRVLAQLVLFLQNHLGPFASDKDCSVFVRGLALQEAAFGFWNMNCFDFLTYHKKLSATIIKFVHLYAGEEHQKGRN